MKWKIKHKLEGWTGTAEIMDERETGSSSHSLSFEVHYFITQDVHKPDGSYVEDPAIDSLDELEFLEQLP